MPAVSTVVHPVAASVDERRAGRRGRRDTRGLLPARETPSRWCGGAVAAAQRFLSRGGGHYGSVPLAAERPSELRSSRSDPEDGRVGTLARQETSSGARSVFPRAASGSNRKCWSSRTPYCPCAPVVSA